MVGGRRPLFLVVVWVVIISLVVGTLVGALSAWWGGWADHVIVRIMDVFLAFPGMLLAIVLSGILGPGIENVVIALVLVGWVGFARLARAQTMSLKEREHVQAAIALGGGVPRILTYHIIPLISAPLIVEATFGIAGAVIAEAGLSFLGLGVQPPARLVGKHDPGRHPLYAGCATHGPGARFHFDAGGPSRQLTRRPAQGLYGRAYAFLYSSTKSVKKTASMFGVPVSATITS